MMNPTETMIRSEKKMPGVWKHLLPHEGDSSDPLCKSGGRT